MAWRRKKGGEKEKKKKKKEKKTSTNKVGRFFQTILPCCSNRRRESQSSIPKPDLSLPDHQNQASKSNDIPRFDSGLYTASSERTSPSAVYQSRTSKPNVLRSVSPPLEKKGSKPDDCQSDSLNIAKTPLFRASKLSGLASPSFTHEDTSVTRSLSEKPLTVRRDGILSGSSASDCVVSYPPHNLEGLSEQPFSSNQRERICTPPFEESPVDSLRRIYNEILSETQDNTTRLNIPKETGGRSRAYSVTSTGYKPPSNICHGAQCAKDDGIPYRSYSRDNLTSPEQAYIPSWVNITPDAPSSFHRDRQSGSPLQTAQSPPVRCYTPACSTTSPRRPLPVLRGGPSRLHLSPETSSNDVQYIPSWVHTTGSPVSSKVPNNLGRSKSSVPKKKTFPSLDSDASLRNDAILTQSASCGLTNAKKVTSSQRQQTHKESPLDRSLLAITTNNYRFQKVMLSEHHSTPHDREVHLSSIPLAKDSNVLYSRYSEHRQPKANEGVTGHNNYSTRLPDALTALPDVTSASYGRSLGSQAKKTMQSLLSRISPTGSRKTKKTHGQDETLEDTSTDSSSPTGSPTNTTPGHSFSREKNANHLNESLPETSTGSSSSLSSSSSTTPGRKPSRVENTKDLDASQETSTYSSSSPGSSPRTTSRCSRSKAENTPQLGKETSADSSTSSFTSSPSSTPGRRPLIRVKNTSHLHGSSSTQSSSDTPPLPKTPPQAEARQDLATMEDWYDDYYHPPIKTSRTGLRGWCLPKHINQYAIKPKPPMKLSRIHPIMSCAINHLTLGMAYYQMRLQNGDVFEGRLCNETMVDFFTRAIRSGNTIHLSHLPHSEQISATHALNIMKRYKNPGKLDWDMEAIVARCKELGIDLPEDQLPTGLAMEIVNPSTGEGALCNHVAALDAEKSEALLYTFERQFMVFVPTMDGRILLFDEHPHGSLKAGGVILVAPKTKIHVQRLLDQYYKEHLGSSFNLGQGTKFTYKMPPPTPTIENIARQQ